MELSIDQAEVQSVLQDLNVVLNIDGLKIREESTGN